MPFFFVALFLIATTFPSSALASGVLVDSRGKVEVVIKGGAPQAGAIGLELPDGSTVTVGAEGSAAVLLESGAVDEIAAGQTYAVGAPSAAAKRTSLAGSLAIAMRELAVRQEGPTVHGMLKELKGPQFIEFADVSFGGIAARFPQGTAIRLGSAVLFRWSEAPAVDWQKPALVIDDAGGRRVVVRPVAPGAHELSVAAAVLKKGGRYSWYLATQEGGLKGKTARFEFQTLSAAEERELDAAAGRIRGLDMSDDGKALLLGQLHVGMGLRDEAVKILEPLWQRTQAPFVKRLLWLALARMSRPEAEKYK